MTTRGGSVRGGRFGLLGVFVVSDADTRGECWEGGVAFDEDRTEGGEAGGDDADVDFCGCPCDITDFVFGGVREDFWLGDYCDEADDRDDADAWLGLVRFGEGAAERRRVGVNLQCTEEEGE